MTEDKKDIGFQAFVNELFSRRHKPHKQPLRTSKYNLTDYLRTLSEMLRKIHIFFSEKAPTNNLYTQNEKLLSVQRHENKELQAKLLETVLRNDSILLNTLSEIFNNHFSGSITKRLRRK